MQRVRGGGNAVRLIALLPCLVGAWRHRAGGLLLSSSGWFSRCATTPRCSGPTCSAGAQAAHDQHEHDRRRPAARGARPSLRPEDRGAGRLQQQPGGGGAASRRKVVQGFAREDLFTVVLEHFMTDTADHADYRAAGHDAARAPGRAHQLRPHLRADQRAGDRAAGRGQAEHADLSRAGGAHGLRPSRASPTTTRRWRAPPSATRWSTSTRCASDGWVKLPLPEAPFAEGGFPTPSGKCMIDAPGLGVPDHVPNYESARSHARAGAALSRWR